MAQPLKSPTSPPTSPYRTSLSNQPVRRSELTTTTSVLPSEATMTTNPGTDTVFDAGVVEDTALAYPPPQTTQTPAPQQQRQRQPSTHTQTSRSLVDIVASVHDTDQALLDAILGGDASGVRVRRRSRGSADALAPATTLRRQQQNRNSLSLNGIDRNDGIYSNVPSRFNTSKSTASSQSSLNTSTTKQAIPTATGASLLSPSKRVPTSEGDITTRSTRGSINTVHVVSGQSTPQRAMSPSSPLSLSSSPSSSHSSSPSPTSPLSLTGSDMTSMTQQQTQSQYPYRHDVVVSGVHVSRATLHRLHQMKLFIGDRYALIYASQKTTTLHGDNVDMNASDVDLSGFGMDGVDTGGMALPTSQVSVESASVGQPGRRLGGNMNPFRLKIRKSSRGTATVTSSSSSSLSTSPSMSSLPSLHRNVVSGVGMGKPISPVTVSSMYNPLNVIRWRRSKWKDAVVRAAAAVAAATSASSPSNIVNSSNNGGVGTSNNATANTTTQDIGTRSGTDLPSLTNHDTNTDPTLPFSDTAVTASRGPSATWFVSNEEIREYMHAMTSHHHNISIGVNPVASGVINTNNVTMTDVVSVPVVSVTGLGVVPVSNTTTPVLSPAQQQMVDHDIVGMTMKPSSSLVSSSSSSSLPSSPAVAGIGVVSQSDVIERGNAFLLEFLGIGHSSTEAPSSLSPSTAAAITTAIPRYNVDTRNRIHATNSTIPHISTDTLSLNHHQRIVSVPDHGVPVVGITVSAPTPESGSVTGGRRSKRSPSPLGVSMIRGGSGDGGGENGRHVSDASSIDTESMRMGGTDMVKRGGGDDGDARRGRGRRGERDAVLKIDRRGGAGQVGVDTSARARAGASDSDAASPRTADSSAAAPVFPAGVYATRGGSTASMTALAAMQASKAVSAIMMESAGVSAQRRGSTGVLNQKTRLGDDGSGTGGHYRQYHHRRRRVRDMSGSQSSQSPVLVSPLADAMVVRPGSTRTVHQQHHVYHGVAPSTASVSSAQDSGAWRFRRPSHRVGMVPSGRSMSVVSDRDAMVMVAAAAAAATAAVSTTTTPYAYNHGSTSSLASMVTTVMKMMATGAPTDGEMALMDRVDEMMEQAGDDVEVMEMVAESVERLRVDVCRMAAMLDVKMAGVSSPVGAGVPSMGVVGGQGVADGVTGSAGMNAISPGVVGKTRGMGDLGALKKAALRQRDYVAAGIQEAEVVRGECRRTEDRMAAVDAHVREEGGRLEKIGVAHAWLVEIGGTRGRASSIGAVNDRMAGGRGRLGLRDGEGRARAAVYAVLAYVIACAGLVFWASVRVWRAAAWLGRRCFGDTSGSAGDVIDGSADDKLDDSPVSRTNQRA